MNQHTRNTCPTSASCPLTATSVAVPVTVLLPAAYPGSRRVRPSEDRPDAAGLTPATAARLVATFTGPGALVVDLTGGSHLARAADWLSRRSTTVITDSEQSRRSYSLNDRPLLPSRRAANRTLAAHATDIPGLLERAYARVGLALATFPTLGATTLGEGDLQRWMIGFQQALRPDGFCILAVPSPGGQADAGSIAAVRSAARVAGLIYHQHLITIDDRPASAADAGIAIGSPTTRPGKIHSDLLCFTPSPSRIYV